MKNQTGIFLCIAFLFFAQGTAYSQRGRPEWVRGRLPQDDKMALFRGEAEGETLEKAREGARKDAYNAAANFFITTIASESFENLINESGFDTDLIDRERTEYQVRIESKVDLSGLKPVDEYREQSSKGFTVYVLYGIDRALVEEQRKEVRQKLEQERKDELARAEALAAFHAGKAKGAAEKAKESLKRAQAAAAGEERKAAAAETSSAAREAQAAAEAAEEAARETYNSLNLQIAVAEAKAAAREAAAAEAAAASLPEPGPRSPRQRGLAAFSPDEFGGVWSGAVSYTAKGRNYRDAYVIELYEGGACWVSVRAQDGTTQTGEGHWSADNGFFRLDCGFENPGIERLPSIAWLSVYRLEAGRLRINIQPAPDHSGTAGVTLNKGK
ncbi:MAG: hypothetical protein LBC31_01005 [Treponema sp.]|jgi:hypothetical protein|nr:hypothetical protein [Treponema sp.]